MSNSVSISCSISSIMCSSLGGGGEGEGGGGEGEGGGVGGGNGGEGGGGNSGEGGGGGGGGGGESSDSTDCSEAITRLERQSKTTKRILLAYYSDYSVDSHQYARQHDATRTLHSSLGSVGKYRVIVHNEEHLLARDQTSNFSKKPQIWLVSHAQLRV